MAVSLETLRISSADAAVGSLSRDPAKANADTEKQDASTRSYDVAIVGCGVIGSVLAAALAKSGRSVIVFDSNLSEPDRSALALSLPLCLER